MADGTVEWFNHYDALLLYIYIVSIEQKKEEKNEEPWQLKFKLNVIHFPIKDQYGTITVTFPSLSSLIDNNFSDF